VEARGVGRGSRGKRSGREELRKPERAGRVGAGRGGVEGKRA